MFDTLPSAPPDTALEAARGLLREHGHALAEAAHFVGGPSAKARVFNLGGRLTRATRMTDRIRRDLVAMHRLSALTGARSLKDLTATTGLAERGYRALLRLVRTGVLAAERHERITPSTVVYRKGRHQ